MPGMNVILWVLFAFAAIIPSLIVAVVFIVKIEALRGDYTRSAAETASVIHIYGQKLQTFSDSNTMAREAFEQADKASLKLANLEESFIALSNKWNSRERAERNAAAREEKQKRKEECGEYDIPGTEQQLMFPMTAGKTEAPPKRRKFGEAL